jgi:hypothetical protein
MQWSFEPPQWDAANDPPILLVARARSRFKTAKGIKMAQAESAEAKGVRTHRVLGDYLVLKLNWEKVARSVR